MRASRSSVPLLLVLFGLSVPALGDDEDRWQKPRDDWQQPSANWQQPGEIQAPTGTWQIPGDFRVPKDVERRDDGCTTRLTVAADTFFAFDRADLTPAARSALDALGPQLAGAAGALSIEGHTDAVGTEEHNEALSRRRAAAVRDHLAAAGHVPSDTPTRGFGEARPVAPNERPDGSDDPDGRALNRRVEIVVRTCAETSEPAESTGG